LIARTAIGKDQIHRVAGLNPLEQGGRRNRPQQLAGEFIALQ
jgi:hypothetical protein